MPRWQYQARFEPLEPIIAAAVPDQWNTQLPDVARQIRVFPHQELFGPVFVDVAVPDQWNTQGPDVVRPVRVFPHQTLFGPLFDVAAGDTNVSWYTQYPGPTVGISQWQYKALMDPVWFENIAGDDTSEAEYTWWQQASEPVMTTDRIFWGSQWLAYEPDPETLPEPDMSTWFRPIEQLPIVPSRIFWGSQWVAYGADPTILVDPVVPDPDAWWRQTEVPPKAAERIFWGYQMITEPPPAENVEDPDLDDWYRLTQQPYLVPHRPSPAWPNVFFVGEPSDIPSVNIPAVVQFVNYLIGDRLDESVYYRAQDITGYTIAVVSTTDGTAITTGTVNGYITQDGGTQAALTNTVVHEGNGQWSVDLTSAEMDASIVSLTFIHSGGVPVSRTICTR
jgi:hypothetical protein